MVLKIPPVFPQAGISGVVEFTFKTPPSRTLCLTVFPNCLPGEQARSRAPRFLVLTVRSGGWGALPEYHVRLVFPSGLGSAVCPHHNPILCCKLFSPSHFLDGPLLRLRRTRASVAFFKVLRAHGAPYSSSFSWFLDSPTLHQTRWLPLHAGGKQTWIPSSSAFSFPDLHKPRKVLSVFYFSPLLKI